MLNKLKKVKDLTGRVRKSKDGKVLVENFAYLTLLQVAGYIFPLITLPYLARVIGVDSFGKIAFAAAIIGWFQTVADWGFNYTATRDVAKNREDKEKVSQIFSNVLWARCILTLFSFILLIILILLVPKFQEISLLLLITFLMIPGHILFPDWFFQAMEKMKYITILNLISKLLFTIAVFVFIKEKSDFILQPLFVSLGFVVSGIIAMYYILVRWEIKLQKPNIKEIRLTIKNSTDIFINNLMPNLYNSFSTFLLGMFGGAVSNGKLDAGSKFIGLGQQFITIISRTFFPYLSRKIDRHNLYAKINIYISLFLSGLLFFFAPLIIKLFFTPEFYDSIKVMQIMSISIFFLSLVNIYGTNYMIIQGYEKQLRNITILSSIIGFSLSFPLIYFFNYIGAALTVSITRGILGLSISIRAVKLKANVC
ncbi:putative O-antigen transporter [bioreactor metagenome]|uniref:Putative O-antigen transporter n=1 Tax=bioreactor metagenome TaxID=1076179 RepID=A0A644UEQ2_9ZZZZ